MLENLLLVWILIGVITFFSLFKLTAPYGRHIKTGWGYEISARLGWVVMESPTIFIILGFAYFYKDIFTIAHYVFLLIWLLHYVHRTLIWPFIAEMRGKKMPMTIPISAFCFNLVNVPIQGYFILGSTSYTSSWLTNPVFMIGLVIFMFGMIVNIISDYYLIRLRKKLGPGYHLPNKYFFKYISSPNYFGEMIEWLGWAILTWSYAGLIFFIWTIANLFPRAIANHKWYQNKFENYPKNRKAIIPGII